MELRAFRTLFEGSIRAMLSWEALAEAGAGVRQEVVADREQLGRTLMLWYAAPEGGPGDWREASDAPVTVAQAADSPAVWQPGAAERIERFRREFASSDEAPVLVLPAYRIGDRLLLMDGSHRAVALYAAGREPRLLVCAVEGPVDARMLPDLGRWSSILDT